MELVVINKDNSRFPLNHAMNPYRAVQSATITANDKSNQLSMKLVSSELIDFEEASYIDIPINQQTYRYFVKGFIPYKILRDNMFEYDLVMPGFYDFLEDTHLYDTDENGVYLMKQDIPVVGDLEYWGNVICWNLNRNLGKNFIKLEIDVDTSDPEKAQLYSEKQYVQFPNANCLAAINEVCTLFKVSYSAPLNAGGDTKYLLRLVDSSEPYPVPIKYGMGKGLYEFEFKTVDSAKIKTKITVLGSSKNLPSYYTDPSSGQIRTCLELPDSYPMSVISHSLAIQKWGPKEAVYINEDIWPRRLLTITEVSPTNIHWFKCDDADFPFYDGDGYFLGGTISMMTGELAGYNFELLKVRTECDGGTKPTNEIDPKWFHIQPVKDGDIRVVPDPELDVFTFHVGDTFYVADIPMPPTYVAEAITKLEQWGLEVYRQVSQPRLNCNITFEHELIKKWGHPVIGMNVHIVDERHGIDKQAPIKSITYDVMQGMKITSCDVSDIEGDNFIVSITKTARSTAQGLNKTGMNQKGTSNTNNVFSLQSSIAEIIGFQKMAEMRNLYDLGRQMWDTGAKVEEIIDGILVSKDGAINADVINAKAIATSILFAQTLVSQDAFISTLISDQAYIEKLVAKLLHAETGFIGDLTADVAFIASLTTELLKANSAFIKDLKVKSLQTDKKDGFWAELMNTTNILKFQKETTLGSGVPNPNKYVKVGYAADITDAVTGGLIQPQIWMASDDIPGIPTNKVMVSSLQPYALGIGTKVSDNEMDAAVLLGAFDNNGQTVGMLRLVNLPQAFYPRGAAWWIYRDLWGNLSIMTS